MVAEVRVINGVEEDSNKRLANKEAAEAWNAWAHSIAGVGTWGLPGGKAISILFSHSNHNRDD